MSGAAHQLQGVDASGVIIGNAIGSAIAQGSSVLGVAGVVGHLWLPPRIIRRDGLVLLFSILLVGLLAANGELERLDGPILLVVYGVYLAGLVQGETIRSRTKPTDPKIPRTALTIIVGLVTVAFSAELVVRNALTLAERWDLTQTAVGTLLIGVGTSLPELALSLGAAAKGRIGLSVGNIIGSNIFDLLVPTGVSSLIHPIRVGWDTLAIDLPFLALITVVTIALFLRRRGLQRWEAFTLIGLYLSFAVGRFAVGLQA